MPRSANQKKKAAVLRSILLERTNPQHPMTMKEIISALDAHGISAERKSIYDDIQMLRELGTDIQTVRGKTVGYYVARREFELPELKLLVDAVRASKFIPEKESAELIKKLSLLAGAHDRKALNRAVFVSNRAKTINNGIYETVDTIHEAMEADRCITFAYFSWTAKKKKELRRGGERYDVSPWAMVWDDSNYYLVGFDNRLKEIRHYRADKMAEVRANDLPRQGKAEFEKFDISSYSSAVFGMFGGKPERVTLACKNRLANVVIDQFGSDITLLNHGDFFHVHVNVVPSDVFLGWVVSFGSDMKVIAPQHIAERLEQLKRQ